MCCNDDILGYPLPKECKVMYLGNINDYVIDDDTYSTRILMITSKKVIARNWYKKDPPPTENWLERDL